MVAFLSVDFLREQPGNTVMLQFGLSVMASHILSDYHTA